MTETKLVLDVEQEFAEWIADLRSEKYAQGKMKLCRVRGEKESFCCLGVKCEQLARKGLLVRHMDTGMGAVGYKVGSDDRYVSDYVVLPIEVAVALGIAPGGRFHLPEPMRGDSCRAPTTLTHLNDNGFTHSQIADVIEYVQANNLWWT